MDKKSRREKPPDFQEKEKKKKDYCQITKEVLRLLYLSNSTAWRLGQIFAFLTKPFD